jgi:hypothetical protein
VVVVVAGHRVCSSDIDKRKDKIKIKINYFFVVVVSLLGAVGAEVVGQVIACGWWLGDGGGHFYWGGVGKGVGGCGGQVEGGAQAVVVVAGRQMHSLDRDKRKKKAKKLTLFFLVFLSGVVGADLVGQVVSRMYGGWLGDDGGGGGRRQGWVRAWGEGARGSCGLA